MTKNLEPGLLIRRALIASLAFGELRFCECAAQANPTGGTVGQGSATINTSGSQLTINQSSASAFINWQTFNINSGESVVFNQPSSSSVTWNYIGDANPSSLNGNLSANGYVILQNPNGFTVGGSAAISAHGLIMTTASTPNLNLSDGGAWSFDTPPPTAKIVNYGQINITGGGSAFLIADDIENNGSISAPGGKIGLYAGEQVLVSLSPDGRSLSTEVTLPQGSVDNEGKLTADGGSIIAQAQTVNQNGLVQANSVQDVNGTIELLAGDTVNLGANSTISAQGDSQGISTGGNVTVKAGNTFSDQSGSSINIAGGAQGGNGGQVEISAPQMSGINSTINGQAAGGFVDGVLFIDPENILLSSSGGTAPANGTVNSGDAPANGTLTINPSTFASTLSAINLSASQNIEVASGWTLANQTTPSILNLSAGNNITVDNGAYIAAGSDWTINLNAGTAYTGTTAPASGNDGIYLNGTAYLQTLNGNINATAANEVILGTGAIRTLAGGSIDVSTTFGDVNSGTGANGYNYYALGTGTTASPYYTPFQLTGSGTQQKINFSVSLLDGIATAAGGNVTINAGADVVSFPTTTAAAGDPGTGAFGPEAGNVTINAGGSVYGHFVEANGTATINAQGNIGTAANNVALSLVAGSWDLITPDNIYLQEVRNPNGVFNNTTTGLTHKLSAGYHLFDYSPTALVDLTAGDGVYLTGNNIPRPDDGVPILLPPVLIINAGAGGVNLESPIANGNVTLSDSDITLFPSPYQTLEINTTDGGWLSSDNGGADTTLLMSDSGLTQWSATTSVLPFGETDHASTPPALENVPPVTINLQSGSVTLDNTTPVSINLTGSQTVSGVSVPASMEDVILQVDKTADINVLGDMIGCTFLGENLLPTDVTTINVGGQIYNAGSFNSITLAQAFPTLSSLEMAPGTVQNWFSLFELAIDPSKLPTQSLLGLSSAQIASYLNQALEFPGINFGNVVYNPDNQTLTAVGPLSSQLVNAFDTATLSVVHYGPNGQPLLDASGHLVLDTISLTPTSSPNIPLFTSLYNESQSAPSLGVNSGGIIIGGMGELDISAASISLGNSDGILSVGNGNVLGRSYDYLTPYMIAPGTVAIPGASINIQTGYLEMPSSTIATFGGGDINLTCTGIIPNSALNNNGVGVTMDLGDSTLAPFETEIMADNGDIALGIYTSGGGNINVTSLGTVNVDSSRIATFDGGDIYITSLTGDVNAGSGSTVAVPVNSYSPVYAFANEPVEYAYANGIIANTLAPASNGKLIKVANPTPGNITVITPEGSIYANLGGIQQEAIGRTLPSGPTITLEAGTPANNDWSSTAPPIYLGNVDLGSSGVIGGSVNVKATGKVSGLVIAQQSADIIGQGLGDLTVIARVVNLTGPSVGPTVVIAQTANVGPNTVANLIIPATGPVAASSSSQAASQQSTAAAQQVATTDTGNGDGDQKKKKEPAMLHIKRVTVILGAAVPGH